MGSTHLIQKKNIRESNFELLRLVCMFYIVLHHFIVHGLKSSGYFGEDTDIVSVFFNSFTIIAVNCFILISGYFGIKISWRAFFHLYILCVFYKLGFTVFSFLNKDYFSIKDTIYSFLPFSNSDYYWFIKNYFYLFILSPILNKVINNSTIKEFISVLVILGLFTFYFGFFWKDKIFYHGYGLLNFIFLYFIGRFISLHTPNITTRKRKKSYLFYYILNSLIVAGIVLAINYSPLSNTWIARFGYPYNSPFIIASSICFFLLFRSFKIKSSLINKLAKSALAIYLIHESSHIKEDLYNFISEIGEHITNQLFLFPILILLAVVIMIVCIFIDNIRVYITNPIENYLNTKNWDKYTEGLINYLLRFIK